MRKHFMFLSFILSFISCKKDTPSVEPIQEICHEINIDLPAFGDSIKLDINADYKYELAYYSASGFGSDEYYVSRSIKPKNGFEIAILNASEIYWYLQYDSIQQTLDTIDQAGVFYRAAKKFNSNDTIFINDTIFTLDKIYITNRYVWANTPDPFPFPTGLTSDNDWTQNGQGFIVFRNQSTGVMGWIKMNLNGSPSIIRSHYEITDTLVIDESICQ